MEPEVLILSSLPQVRMAHTPVAMNMKVPTKFQTGCNKTAAISPDRREECTDLQNAPLDVLSSVYDVSNDEDAADDCEGDQGGVSEVLHVNVGISVAKFEGSGCKEKVVSIIPMSKICRSCVFSVNKNYFSIKVVCRDLQY